MLGADSVAKGVLAPKTGKFEFYFQYKSSYLTSAILGKVVSLSKKPAVCG